MDLASPATSQAAVYANGLKHHIQKTQINMLSSVLNNDDKTLADLNAFHFCGLLLSLSFFIIVLGTQFKRM